MAGKSKIEWTEQTWNPIVGCSIVSPGCTNCYAMKMAARIEAMGNQPRYDGTTRKVKGKAIWTGKVAIAPDSALLAPLRRKKPTMYFVNSMSDLFHESVPDEWIDRIFAVMALSPQHTFQVLTKRAARMQAYMTAPDCAHRIYDIICDEAIVNALTDVALIAHPSHAAIAPKGRQVHLGLWPLPNVWLGVSTERQQEADERIPHLLATPAAVRFISAEPLLGPIDLTQITVRASGEPPEWLHYVDALTGDVFDDVNGTITGAYAPGEAPKLDWVITGGESGSGARPTNPQWFRDIRDQCAAAEIEHFHKQNGAWVSVSEVAGAGDHFTFPDGRTVRRVGKANAGRTIDGVEHNGMPRGAS